MAQNGRHLLCKPDNLTLILGTHGRWKKRTNLVKLSCDSPQVCYVIYPHNNLLKLKGKESACIVT